MPTRDLADASPALYQAFVNAKAVFDAVRPGRVVIPICVYRSPEEQWATWMTARHQLPSGTWAEDDVTGHHRGILTNCDGRMTLSNHNYRPSRAIDFAVQVDGTIDWNLDAGYAEFGHLCVAQGLVYGGDWIGFKDHDHLELRKLA